MDRSSSGEALLICSCGYKAAAASVKADDWLDNLLVGGGEVSWGVGGVGVRMAEREFGSCEEGGGVMEEVARGAGDVNLTRSGDASFDMMTAASDSERKSGVSGRATSVVGIRVSGAGGYKDAWESILPEAQVGPGSARHVESA